MTRKRTTENDLAPTSAAPARRKAAPRTRTRIAPAAASEVGTGIEAPALLPESATAADEPSHIEIARLAYSYWEARGCQGGSADEDWLRAEQELRSRSSAAVA